MYKKTLKKYYKKYYKKLRKSYKLKKNKDKIKHISNCFKIINRKNFVSYNDQFNNWKEDRPLNIGMNQTTSQPSLIINMLSMIFEKYNLLQHQTNIKVLDIGSGSGIVTALIACIIGSNNGNKVLGIDKFKKLVNQSRKNIKKIPYQYIKKFAKITFEVLDIYDLLLNKSKKFHNEYDIIYVGAEPKTLENISIFKKNIPKLLKKKNGIAIAPIEGKIHIYTKNYWQPTTTYTRFVPLEPFVNTKTHPKFS